MSSIADTDDLIEVEMEVIAEVLAEALQDGDSQVVKGIQRFGATNWTVFMTPGQIIGTLIRMNLEGRDWCVLDSRYGRRDMREDEKKFYRYLHDDLETGVEYLSSLYEWELIEVRLPEHLEILVEHAVEGHFSDEDRRVLRGLDNEYEEVIKQVKNSRREDRNDAKEVLEMLKGDPEKWSAIRLHPEAWDDYLSEMEHSFDERIHTHALGNIIGISAQEKGETVYRPIRRIINNHSGETVPLDELREEFTRVGRQDRFDFWVRHEQQLRDPMRLISFDDGFHEVTIDRDRAAHRALERINARAQERYQEQHRSS